MSRINDYEVGDKVELDFDFMDEIGLELYERLAGEVGEVISWKIGGECALPDEPVYTVKFPDGTEAMCFEEELLLR